MSKKKQAPKAKHPSGAKQEVKKPIIKQWWFWVGLVLVAVVAVTVILLIQRPKTKVSATLDACIVDTIMEEFRSSRTENKYPTMAYTTLDVDEDKHTVTVYGVMMYREYTATTQGELKVWGNAQRPFVLTAKKTGKGYTAAKCWWPDTGADYVSSIEKKFPRNCRDDAVNSQQYYADHAATCDAAAKKHIDPKDQYTMLLSDAGNLWLGYQAQGDGAYLVADGAFAADGIYRAAAENAVELVFGDCVVYFDCEGENMVYRAKKSANVPDEWSTRRGQEYLIDGTRLTPSAGGEIPDVEYESAPVGETFTVSGNNWMSKEEITALFGYVPQDFPLDTANVHYLPVCFVNSRYDLDRVLSVVAAMEGNPWPDLTAENMKQFDEEFFKENSLLMTYYKNGSCSVEPTVSAYVYTEEGKCLSVRLEVRQPETGDQALGQWILFSGIKRADYVNIGVLEAYVQRTIKEEASSTLMLTGTVKEIDGTAMLMECFGDTPFTNGVWVEFGNLSFIPKVGETYVVNYEDIVMPSLPPRITAVSIKPKG